MVFFNVFFINFYFTNITYSTSGLYGQFKYLINTVNNYYYYLLLKVFCLLVFKVLVFCVSVCFSILSFFKFSISSCFLTYNLNDKTRVSIVEHLLSKIKVIAF